MRSVLTKPENIETAFDRRDLQKPCDHEIEAIKFLQSTDVMEAFAAASTAVSNNIQGATLHASLINGDIDEVLVTVVVDKPSVELNQRIQKLVRESHPNSRKLLEIVTFSL